MTSWSFSGAWHCSEQGLSAMAFVQGWSSWRSSVQLPGQGSLSPGCASPVCVLQTWGTSTRLFKSGVLQPGCSNLGHFNQAVQILGSSTRLFKSWVLCAGVLDSNCNREPGNSSWWIQLSVKLLCCSGALCEREPWVRTFLKAFTSSCVFALVCQ